jgi:hypothetical protein
MGKKFKTLNSEHKEIIENYFGMIDEFIYNITEDAEPEKWKMFQPLKSECIRLHNELGQDIENDSPINYTEWVFMLPNFLLFGSIGFATALKNTHNITDINEDIKQLYADMSATILNLDAMLYDHQSIMERKKTKLKNKLKKND